MLEISDREVKITMIRAKGSSGKSKQHAKRDGQCKQRDGNSKKHSKGNARDQKH